MKSNRKLRLVLVGAGHAHVQVLKRWIMAPHGAAELYLIHDRTDAVYSGMVPGLVSGQYSATEIGIDLVPLARLAQATLILDRVVRIDAENQLLEFEQRPPLPYDIASLNVGATVRGLDLPGVREHALRTRPIHHLADELRSLDEKLRAKRDGFRAVVVGAGAAGVELALALHKRAKKRNVNARVRVLESSPTLLPSFSAGARAHVEREFERREITWRSSARVSHVDQAACVLEDESERYPFDVLLWATGAKGHPFLQRSGLATNQEGFLLTRSTLQLVNHDDVFAAGDCAHLVDAPWVPKSGVYAVRQGPVLYRNLTARLDGYPLKSFRPQKDALALLNLANDQALAEKWGRTQTGEPMMRLKDAIDRRFMRRFQVLDRQGYFSKKFKHLSSMGSAEPMACAGCAAKASAAVLNSALERLGMAKQDADAGLPLGDDASAHRLGQSTLVTSVDAFRAFSPDHYLVGRVAAVNAASDVVAKGAVPWFAHAIVSLPEDLHAADQEQMLFETLSGARRELERMGATLAGGHTLVSSEFNVGLCVTGRVPEGGALMPQGGAAVGEKLLLTKALGTGVILNAAMHGRTSGKSLAAAEDSMLENNARAAALAASLGASAVTDVTGFGLAGHLLTMLRASRKSATLSLQAVPCLPGAVALVESGVKSTFFQENFWFSSAVDVSLDLQRSPVFELLFDPQTSGGLLISVAPEQADVLEQQLQSQSPATRIIGTITELENESAPPRLSVVQ